jgi:hypothetical protein
MKRRLVWLVALAGLVWLYVRRGVRRPQPVVQIPPAADPAEELRRKLEETKERGEDAASHLAEPEPEGEPGEQSDPAELLEPPAPVVLEELDAKRREVHERARSASDEMRRSSTD